MCGFFLIGINEDEMPEALKTHPAACRIFASADLDQQRNQRSYCDPIAGRASQRFTRSHRFQSVRLSRFSGGHEVNRADLRSALKWFREQGHF